MADEKKKVGLEAAVLGLVLVVVVGGFWMTWRVTADSTEQAAREIKLKIDGVEIGVKQVGERINRLSNQMLAMEAKLSGAVPPADSNGSAGDDTDAKTPDMPKKEAPKKEAPKKKSAPTE